MSNRVLNIFLLIFFTITFAVPASVCAAETSAFINIGITNEGTENYIAETCAVLQSSDGNELNYLSDGDSIFFSLNQEFESEYCIYISESGTYTYYIYQTVLNEFTGETFDTSVYIITVTADTDDNSIYLTVMQEGETVKASSVSFVNTYKNEVIVKEVSDRSTGEEPIILNFIIMFIGAITIFSNKRRILRF